MRTSPSISPTVGGVAAVDDLGLLVEDLEHPVGAGAGLQRHVQDLCELVERPGEHAGEDEERRHGADVDGAAQRQPAAGERDERDVEVREHRRQRHRGERDEVRLGAGLAGLVAQLLELVDSRAPRPGRP